MARIKFPVLAALLLIFAIVWILDELNVFVINLPWIPVILAVIAIGMIINRYSR